MATLIEAFEYTTLRAPEAEALVFEDRRYSYAELMSRSRQMARELIDAGLRPGDRCALLSDNSDDFVVAFLGILTARGVVVPVNPAATVFEVQHILTDSGASVLAAAAPLLQALGGADGLDSPQMRAVVAMGPGTDRPDAMARSRSQEDGPLDIGRLEDDNALILYTSGTTGRPKGALFDNHRILWASLAGLPVTGLRPTDSLLHAAPLYHGAELCILLIPGLILGAKHVVLPRFEPGRVLAAMQEEGTTLFFGVPTMYKFLLMHPDRHATDLSTWRTGLFGAAPMSGALVGALAAAFPGLELIQLCGQTEGGPGGIYSSGEDVKARPDASGRRALPMSECRIVGADGRPVAPGEVGEMLLRGESVMKEYWGNPEATAETMRGGWLHTGDLVRLDDDGYMTVVDRLKDLIITGGRNVYSIEVENALNSIDSIREAAVVGRPHDDFGESIVAYVVPMPDVDLDIDDLKERCGELISHYKIPHMFIVSEGLPRNPSGKIMKRDLRRL